MTSLPSTFGEREVKIRFKCLTTSQMAQYYGFIVVLISIEHIYSSLNFRYSIWKGKVEINHASLYAVNSGTTCTKSWLFHCWPLEKYYLLRTYFIHNRYIRLYSTVMDKFFLKWPCNQTSLVWGRHNVDFVKITEFVFVNISNKTAITF